MVSQWLRKNKGERPYVNCHSGDDDEQLVLCDREKGKCKDKSWGASTNDTREQAGLYKASSNSAHSSDHIYSRSLG